MNNYNYQFPNGNNGQNNWQNYNQNGMQDNGMYGFQRQPMNYQQMRGMMNQNMMNQNMPQTTSKIDRVNGREGAEAYFLMPNSEVLLLDTTNPIVWLKQTDSAGYGTITVQLRKNGILQPQALASQTAADTTSSNALSFSTLVQVDRNNCKCNVCSIPVTIDVFNASTIPVTFDVADVVVTPVR